MKRLLALSMVLLMMLCLCACAAANEPAKETEPTTKATEPTTEATEPTTEATEPVVEPTYVVTVQDQNGDPVANAFVQLCLESCFPSLTDENGVANFFLDEADYKVGFTVMPEGYEYVDDQEAWYFADGENTMTIVINKIA